MNLFLRLTLICFIVLFLALKDPGPKHQELACLRLQ